MAGVLFMAGVLDCLFFEELPPPPPISSLPLSSGFLTGCACPHPSRAAWLVGHDQRTGHVGRSTPYVWIHAHVSSIASRVLEELQLLPLRTAVHCALLTDVSKLDS